MDINIRQIGLRSSGVMQPVETGVILSGGTYYEHDLRRDERAFKSHVPVYATPFGVFDAGLIDCKVEDGVLVGIYELAIDNHLHELIECYHLNFRLADHRPKFVRVRKKICYEKIIVRRQSEGSPRSDHVPMVLAVDQPDPRSFTMFREVPDPESSFEYIEAAISKNVLTQR